MTTSPYRERLRRDIAASAAVLLEAEGFSAIQARRIAQEAGCSVGTIYNLFGDIDGVLIAVNTQTLAMLGDAVGENGSALAGRPLRDRLIGLGLAYTRFATANQRRWEAVFKHQVTAGREVPPSYLADQDRLIAVIETALGPADQLGGLHRRAMLARSLFGAVHGIVALALDNRIGGRIRADLEAHVITILDLAATGLEAAPTRPR